MHAIKDKAISHITVVGSTCVQEILLLVMCMGQGVVLIRLVGCMCHRGYGEIYGWLHHSEALKAGFTISQNESSLHVTLTSIIIYWCIMIKPLNSSEPGELKCWLKLLVVMNSCRAVFRGRRRTCCSCWLPGTMLWFWSVNRMERILRSSPGHMAMSRYN